MEASPIFNETVKLLRGGQRGIIHQGGQSSGKTVNILGALAVIACERQGCVITVTSTSFPHLKGGALRDFETFVLPSFRSYIAGINKTDHIFLFKNGAIIEFKSFENEKTARGPKRDILFVNEANLFDWMRFWQLNSRSKQTIIDYNPSIRFWAHEKLMSGESPGWVRRISDHRDNHFLTPEKHAEIEGNKDKEIWRVYARGLTGNTEGLIFPNWKFCLDELPDTDGGFFYAIDFGYTNDPTAIYRMCAEGNNIYTDELWYHAGGVSAHNVSQILKMNGYDEEEPVYCENDPDQIKELRLYDVRSIGARKGPGSVRAGIMKIKKQYNVFATKRSKHLKLETEKYSWEKDEKTGLLLNQPVDAFNHGIDANRYGIYTRFWRQGDEQTKSDLNAA